MDTTKLKRNLDKINLLVPHLEDGASPIEVDLLKSYVRELYEALLVEGATLTDAPKKVAKAPAAVKKAVVVQKPTPPPTPEPEPVAVEETPLPEPPKPEPKPAPKPEPPKPEPKPEPVVIAPTKKARNTKLAELFTFAEARELSEKLSNRPIPDLTKAMGLNERILTVNELFQGDNAAFNVALKDLNSMPSFDEAIDLVLEPLAEKFDWALPANERKAKVFIQLIRRRYL